MNKNKIKVYDKERSERLLASGVCVIHKHPIVEGRKVSCQKCLILKKEGYERRKGTLKHCFVRYRTQAKHRKIDFVLSLEEFGLFWQKDCHYCGDKIVTVGIDRICSTGKYVIGNVVSCCSTCNYMKASLSPGQLLVQCTKIVAHRNGVSICDNVIIGMRAGVVKDITESGIYMGTPAKYHGPYVEGWNF